MRSSFSERRRLEHKIGVKMVFSNKNLKGIEKYWEINFKPPAPLPQPDIDLLIADIGFKLHAVELKYIRVNKDGRISHSYYEGIDGALSLLLFGVQGAYLWQCFDENVPPRIVNDYGRNAEKLIIKLKLPIGYSALRVLKINDKIDFKEITPTTKEEISERDRLPYIGLAKNPMLEDKFLRKDLKNVKDFLRKKLGIARATD